jgi:hypothetical protein
MTGSFLGLSSFGIVIVPEVLKSFALGSTNASACWGVAAAPLAGADCIDGAGLSAGAGDESRPHFSGRGLEIAKRSFQKSRYISLKRKHCNTPVISSS